jgi:hypothetical protein
MVYRAFAGIPDRTRMRRMSLIKIWFSGVDSDTI